MVDEPRIWIASTIVIFITDECFCSWFIVPSFNCYDNTLIYPRATDVYAISCNMFEKDETPWFVVLSLLHVYGVLIKCGIILQFIARVNHEIHINAIFNAPIRGAMWFTFYQTWIVILPVQTTILNINVK